MSFFILKQNNNYTIPVQKVLRSLCVHRAVIFPHILVFFKKKYKRNLITGLREQNRRSPPKVPNNSKGHMTI